MEDFQLFGRRWRIRPLVRTGRRILLALAVGSAAGLLGLLAWSTGNASRYAQQHDLLLLLNGILAATLLVWVLVLAGRLVRQIRHQQFGARLTARFALFFALIGALPGSLIYVLSVQFMSRSIESWFNVRVDSALEAGLGLARAALDLRLADVQRRAQDLAANLHNASDAEIAATIARLRDIAGVPEALVFSGANHIVAFSSAQYRQFGQLVPEIAPAHILNQLRISRSYAATEVAPVLAQDNANASSERIAIDAPTHLQFRVILPITPPERFPTLSGASIDARWLQVIQPVPEQIAVNANLVQQGVNDYQELTLSRQGLRQLYSITLTLALLLTIFAAMVVALALSRRLLRSLLRLAEGTQAVGTGDYRPLPEPPPRDEIGQLTRSFNAMTRQLEGARNMVERNRQRLQRANLYLESVLSNLSAGVLVFDEVFRVTLTNQGAQTILHADLRTVIGKPLTTVPGAEELAQRIRQAFAAHAAVESDKAYWQQQFELTPKTAPATANAPAHPLTLLARGTHLHIDERPSGYLVVFDDVSDVISANRIVAWGEVARRLTHEIKNPLTPIQLSAERLEMKLSDRLDPQDAAMLKRSVRTIVNQVDALKNMVNDFRDYARTPPAQMRTVDLNALIRDVVTLYGWEQGEACMAQEPGHQPRDLPQDPAQDRQRAQQPRIVLECAPDLPLIVGDPAQLRQVLHNLLANARDAATQDQTVANATLWVHTRQLTLQDQSENRVVRLVIMDNGPGFAPGMLARVFEPYTTTKAAGTGLGLAIVHKIVEEHGGRIDVGNRREGGARISILFRRLAAGHDGGAARDEAKQDR